MEEWILVIVVSLSISPFPTNPTDVGFGASLDPKLRWVAAPAAVVVSYLIAPKLRVSDFVFVLAQSALTF